MKLLVTTKGAVKYFGKIIKWTSLGGPAVTLDMADEGKELAMSVAPIDSGALVRKIGIRQARGRGYVVTSRMPTQGSNARRKAPVPYHLWMHGLDGKDISGHIKTGNPRYMEYAHDKLKERYPNEMFKSLKKKL